MRSNGATMMRGAAAWVVASVAGVAAVAGWGCDGSSGGGGSAVNTTGGATASGDATSGGPGVDAGALDKAAVVDEATGAGGEPEDEALAKLRAALTAAGPLVEVSTAERMEEAMAWIAANRDPASPFNAFEARILAIWAEWFDGETDTMSVSRMVSMMEVEIEIMRGMDLDGDGRLSEGELDQWVESGMFQMNPMEHPFVRAKFDEDGDGTLNEAETKALTEYMQKSFAEGMLPVRDQAALVAWDSDGDGVLGDGEREAAMAEVLAKSPFLDFDKNGKLEGGEADAASWTMASEYFQQMRLEDMGVAQQEQAAQGRLMQEHPAPDFNAFDIDGEAGLSTQEAAEFQRAMEGWREELEAAAGLMARDMIAKRFESALSRHDVNSDGLLMPDEWERRLTEMRRERDTRMFRYHYDTNKDGAVDSSEVDGFLQWHRAGSMRADANLDGRVDPLDIQAFMQSYETAR